MAFSDNRQWGRSTAATTSASNFSTQNMAPGSQERIIQSMDYLYSSYFTTKLKRDAHKLKNETPGYETPIPHEPYIGDIGPASKPNSFIHLSSTALASITGSTTLTSINEEGRTDGDAVDDDSVSDSKTLTGSRNSLSTITPKDMTKGFSGLTITSTSSAEPRTPPRRKPLYHSTPIPSPQSPMGTLHISQVTRDHMPIDASPGVYRIARLMIVEGHIDKDGLAAVLPIARYETKILDALERNQFIVIEGFTGCGKSTQVPQFILDFFEHTKQRCNIAVTQPRRIAAVSLAKRVSSERGWELGKVVGYQVALDRTVKSDTTRITYMTTGVLLRQLIAKKALKPEYTHIIIDEAHERDVEIDLLLACIRKVLVENKDSDTRIIIMSATINAFKFVNYFFDFSDRQPTKDEEKIIKIGPQKFYQVRQYYLDDIQRVYGADFTESVLENTEFDLINPIFNESFFNTFAHVLEYLEKFEAIDLPPHYFEEIFEQGAEEDEEDFSHPFPFPNEALIDPGSVEPQSIQGILVFLPGMFEIMTLCKKLNEIVDSKKKEWIVLPLHSSISNEEQQRIFEVPPDGWRKIILATNIAESSITVPEIGYVFDFCLTKSMTCDFSTKFSRLNLEWTSQQQTIQRRGRIGRIRNGICFRLVPKSFYKKLRVETVPDIKKSSLDKVVLDAKLLGLGPPQEILGLTLDPPPLTGVRNAIKNLKEIGALNITVRGVYKEYDGDITVLGKIMSQFPLDVKLARLIILGHVFGVLEEAIIIAASLSVNGPFQLVVNDKLGAYLNKLEWARNSFSDNIAILNLYRSFLLKYSECNGNKAELRKWCKSYFADCNVLMEIRLIQQEIVNRLSNFGINVNPAYFVRNEISLDEIYMVKIVIAGSLYPTYFTQIRPATFQEYVNNIHRAFGGDAVDPKTSIIFTELPNPERNPNELYGQQLVDRFWDLTELKTRHSLVPYPRFDGGKAFLTFDPRTAMTGQLSPYLYRAIKLRQLQTPFVINTINPDAGREMYQNEIGIYPSLGHDCPVYARLPQVHPREKIVQVYVTNIVSPTEFWAVWGPYMDFHVRMQGLLNSFTKPYDKVDEDKLLQGKIYIVKFKEEWFRGRIDFINEELQRIMVFLIDTGMSFWTSANGFHEFPEEFKECGMHIGQCLAIPCRIYGISPPKMYAGVWKLRAIDLFRNTIQPHRWAVIHLKIIGIVKGVMAVDIFLKEEPHMRDHLIKHGLASETEELPNAKANIERRIEILRTGRRNQAIEREEIGKPDQRHKFPSPSSLKCQLTWTEWKLKGPSSPLEMEFQCITQNTAYIRGIPEPNSVNSVPLDQDPFSSAGQFLVVANPALGTRNTNISLKESTLMPPVPGLLGIISMIFAPVIQMQNSGEPSKYSGLICGLGYDPETKSSIYPNHDYEVDLNFHFDDSDLQCANTIRTEMNRIIQSVYRAQALSDPNGSPICELLYKMINRPRAPDPANAERSPVYPSFTWCSTPEFDKDLLTGSSPTIDAGESLQGSVSRRRTPDFPDPFLMHSLSSVTRASDEEAGPQHVFCARDVPLERVKKFRDCFSN